MLNRNHGLSSSDISAVQPMLEDIEYSCPLNDVSLSQLNTGVRRRVSGAISSKNVPKEAVLVESLTAWHWVLHWISDKSEPQATAIRETNNRTYFIISSTVNNTTVDELRCSVSEQLENSKYNSEHVSTELSETASEALSCHSIKLYDDGEACPDRAEVELILCDGNVIIDCSASCFNESYQQYLLELWEHAFKLLESNSNTCLSELTLYHWEQSQVEEMGLLGATTSIEGSLIDRFTEIVRQSGHGTAIVDDTVSLSYVALDELSSSWAEAMFNVGVVFGSPVGLVFNTKYQMVVAQLAVLKLGGIFVPMDAEQPQSRLESILEDTGLKIILTEQECASELGDKLAKENHPELNILIGESIPDGSGAHHPCPASSDDTAYIIFTSGSTGKPKGVKVSHANLINFVQFMSTYVGANDVSSQFAPFTFDASVAEIHTSVMNGGTLVMLGRHLIDNPGMLQDYLTEQRVTFSAFPPSYAKHLQPESLPFQKTLLTAGSAPDHEFVRVWQPRVTYINAYGPTETTILSTLWEADHIVNTDKPIVMGSPISNTQIKLVNRFGHMLPPGFIGELIIGGAGVTQGYINRKEATEEKYYSENDVQWYRSGDLASLDPQGQLIFYGRVDNQIKLRGHRLELGEVEAAFKSIVQVKSSAAWVSKENKVAQLCVFCVGDKMDDVELREKLKNLLPPWALPNRVIWVDTIPLTVNGKTDHKALAMLVPASDTARKSAEVELSMTPVESSVAAIWQDVLHVSQVGPEDNFIYLGGDSLTALSVSSALKKAGYDISSSLLLSKPMLKEFSEALKDYKASENGATDQNDLPLLDRWRDAMLETTRKEIDSYPEAVAATYPLTDMQKIMYRHKKHYQVWMYYEFARSFNTEAFLRAVEFIVCEHDCMRTCVHPVLNDAIQIVLEDWRPKVQIHKAHNNELEIVAESLITAARLNEVNIENEPSVSFDVVHGDKNTFLVLLSIHHINHDGWSINLIFDSLFKEYLYQLGESNSRASTPDASMEAVVHEQMRMSVDKGLSQYWSDRPWKESFCRLSSKSSVSTSQSSKMNLISRPLVESLAGKVRQTAKQAAVTPNVIWMTAYAIMLRYLGGTEQVRFGVLHSGRMETIKGIESITGCCVNTLPMVLDINKGDSQEGIVQNISHCLARMRDGMAFPISQIDALAKDKIDTDLFECLFNIESDNYINSNDTERPQLIGGYEATNASMNFSIIEHKEKFGLRIGYKQDFFEDFYVEQIAEVYQRCVLQLVDEIKSPWNSSENLYGNQSKKLLSKWNDTCTEIPDGDLWKLFVNTAEEYRTKDALWQEGKHSSVSYSYLQLRNRAESLSSSVRKVLPGGADGHTTVAIYSERSIALVVSVLALSRLGYAYLPLDVKYPEERIEHMLTDSGCTLALVHTEEVPSVFEDNGCVVLNLRDESNYVESHEKQSDLPEIGRDRLAYIMYTSGSTGNPKGVLISQKSVISLVCNNNYSPLKASDNVLLTGAPVFDATTYEIWGCLLNGACLNLVDESALLDTQELSGLISGRSISTMWLTAGLFNRHVAEKPDMFSTMKQLLVGGDALSIKHIKLARAQNPELTIINGYGPTENTTFSVCYRIEKDSSIDPDNDIPIGKPIQNSTAHIVNDVGQELPVGAHGELWVGGDGVSIGYLNQPTLTCDKFVEDKFGNGQTKLYKTGDCARWNPAGLVEFFGRIDDQVKVRGFRIELGEIENRLVQHAMVRETRVVVKEGRENSKQIVAYVAVGDMPAKVSDPDLNDQLRAFVGKSLPDYMVPTLFVVLKQLPLNQNGKIDRKMLPEPDFTNLGRSTEVQAETDTEKKLLGMLGKILGYSCHNVESDFFRLGATSLDAVKFISEIRDTFSIEIGIGPIFNAGSMQELALFIDEKISDDQKSDDIDIESLSEEELDRYISQLTLEKGL